MMGLERISFTENSLGTSTTYLSARSTFFVGVDTDVAEGFATIPVSISLVLFVAVEAGPLFPHDINIADDNITEIRRVDRCFMTSFFHG